MRETQHGVKISYGASPQEHDTYVVYVPLEHGAFPQALNEALLKAANMLGENLANDCLHTS